MNAHNYKENARHNKQINQLTVQTLIAHQHNTL